MAAAALGGVPVPGNDVPVFAHTEHLAQFIQNFPLTSLGARMHIILNMFETTGLLKCWATVVKRSDDVMELHMGDCASWTYTRSDNTSSIANILHDVEVEGCSFFDTARPTETKGYGSILLKFFDQLNIAIGVISCSLEDASEVSLCVKAETTSFRLLRQLTTGMSWYNSHFFFPPLSAAVAAVDTEEEEEEELKGAVATENVDMIISDFQLRFTAAQQLLNTSILAVWTWMDEHVKEAKYDYEAEAEEKDWYDEAATENRLEASRQNLDNFIAVQLLPFIRTHTDLERQVVITSDETSVFSQLGGEHELGYPYRQLGLRLLPDLAHASLKSVRDWLRNWHDVTSELTADVDISTNTQPPIPIASFHYGLIEMEGTELCAQCYADIQESESMIERCPSCQNPFRHWTFHNTEMALGALLQQIHGALANSAVALRAERTSFGQTQERLKSTYMNRLQIASTLQELVKLGPLQTVGDLFRFLARQMQQQNVAACDCYSYLSSNSPWANEMTNIWNPRTTKYVTKYYKRRDVPNRSIHWFWFQSQDTGLTSVRQRVARQSISRTSMYHRAPQIHRRRVSLRQ